MSFASTLLQPACHITQSHKLNSLVLLWTGSEAMGSASADQGQATAAHHATKLDMASKETCED